MSGRTCAAGTLANGAIINHRAIWNKYALHEAVAGIEIDRAVRRIHLGGDMALVVGIVIEIQLCYPISFLSDSSGAFALSGWFIPARFSIYFHQNNLMLRTRGRIIALVSLTAYALQSPVMQWDLGITIEFILP